MVDLVLLAMAIASALSLIVVSPREAQREALRSLREYAELESLRTHDHGAESSSAPVVGLPLGISPDEDGTCLVPDNEV